PATGGLTPFSLADQRLAESLASQAAIALTNRLLLTQLEKLFESFIGLINVAIDDKSPYTRGHCERVPVLTLMLAEAAAADAGGRPAVFRMSDQDRYELKISGLLHDCGKVTTPVHVVDKATKLHTLYDRINTVDTRFEVLKRDAEIEMLKGLAALRGPADAQAGAELRTAYETRLAQLESDREFLRRCNIGGETMSDADMRRVRQIGSALRWRDAAGRETDFLSADEIENLTIRAGTLTAAEREIINHHIVATIKMLEQLPWPRHLRHVPEYAGGHHERMDGKGYPRGLTRGQMSVQARIMGIADIFEALTARDRPYKPGKTLSEALFILGKLKEAGHIDPDLFDVFIRRRVYADYAGKFLEPRQIDSVDESRIPGYDAGGGPAAA
ncbi:MAG TPA: HD domain-containing phosphohydrolase, partial [Elusimicrobiales bacterium]|nr:HD domain-containing phosphohydrolase [Elusimicrobiales bacterium]